MNDDANQTTPRLDVWADGRWVRLLRYEVSTQVGGAVHVTLAAGPARDAVDDGGLVTLRLARRSPSFCGQLLQTIEDDAEATTLVVSPLGFVERDADVGTRGDDYLIPPDGGAPIEAACCHRLRTCCRDGNHVRLVVPTSTWLDRLCERFVDVGRCVCTDCEAETLDTPAVWPGRCRRVASADGDGGAFEVVRLGARERVVVSIDMVNVMPARTVLIAHERVRRPL